MSKYIISIDQGTTSSRAIIFDYFGSIVSFGQKEHRQIFPQAGWVEHDAIEIWNNVREVVAKALAKANFTRHDILSIGITNQRETTVIWDKTNGQPVYNAIVWQDTRTQNIINDLSDSYYEMKFNEKTGLPLNSYFSATKIKWILDNIPNIKSKANSGNLLFGTMDSWLIWNLSGGIDGGIHITDVTNASRTLFMNLETLNWDNEILKYFGIPKCMMPKIKSSSEIYTYVHGSQLLREVPISGILGDQQAATFGQAAFQAGQAKNTYGTGCFLIFNTGKKIIKSKNGLLTTVAYKLGNNNARYALEGSVAVTGSLVQWLRDNLNIIKSASEIESLAKTVDNNGGIYFVPAFSGLFAPYWNSNARGALVGITRYITKGHIARAALEATAFQTCEILDSVCADSNVSFNELKVDGGMVVNETLMQFQANILGVPIIRPKVIETTALGAAYVAGLSIKFWKDCSELTANWSEGKKWLPKMNTLERSRQISLWKKAVTKTFDWIDEDEI